MKVKIVLLFFIPTHFSNIQMLYMYYISENLKKKKKLN